MPIHPSQISVVIQGAVGPITRHTILSIRQFLPGAEIILSTWEQSDLGELQADRVVLSRDPGGLPGIKKRLPEPNNVNRQIVSTAAGLARATRPYAVKIRADAYLIHAGFLNFDVAERIAVCSFFTLDPTMFEHVPYHISDWFQFGPTALLQQYWDVPPMSVEDATWYDTHPHRAGSSYLDRTFRCRLPVEQYLATHYAARFGYALPTFHNDTRDEVLRDHWHFVKERVIILDPDQIGLQFDKYERLMSSGFQHLNCLTHRDWQALHRPGIDAGRRCHKGVARWMARQVDWLGPCFHWPPVRAVLVCILGLLR